MEKDIVNIVIIVNNSKNNNSIDCKRNIWHYVTLVDTFVERIIIRTIIRNCNKKLCESGNKNGDYSLNTTGTKIEVLVE